MELDGLNKYVYKTNLLESLLEEYSNIKLCLDFGRIHLQECIDYSFSGLDIIKKFGKYTFLVHLWNSRIDRNEHYPALKSLRVEDGWGDMESYIKTLNEKNNDYKVLFEHQSQLISDKELEECYKWIGGLVYKEFTH